jgi:preprotein translocase SecF subunit
VFNLVKYRYVFLAISLVVIIPGLISLIFFGLNIGIDFAGGSNIELRPQKSFANTNQVAALLQAYKLSDQQIVLGDDKTIQGNKTIWVRLNTQIDQNVQNTIQTTLTNKYPGTPKLSVTFTDVPMAGGKTFTMVTISSFTNAPSVSDIQATLSKLPNTTNPASSGSSSATPAPTPTPAATSTPKASSTPKATTTPAVAAGTFPVNVVDVVQGTTTQTVSILTKSDLTSKDIPGLQAAFFSKNGPYFQVISTAEVGGSVAQETTRNAFFAVLAASFFILLYIWFSFRKVAKAWRYGTCALIALLHDVLVVVGIFSILGKLFNIQIDALFITALLTVCGFSVHDTIVVFDRIRENMQRRTTETFEQVVNASLVQTMARSLNTSLTVLFTLLALTLFGGVSIRNFTLTLLIGIFSGTYSSIFNASMLLVIWEKGELGLSRWGGRRETPSGRRERESRELARSRG